MNDERFRNIAAGIQSLILAIAVVVGGGWALFSFLSLSEIEKAAAELQQLQRGLRERGILKIEIVPEPLPRAATGDVLLSVNVSIENTGSRTEVLRWDQSGLLAAPVLINKGQPVFGARSVALYRIAGTDTPLTSSILPGQSREFPFIFTLPTTGVYQLVFEAIVSPVETEAQLSEHLAVDAQVETIVWRTAKYYTVE